MSKLRIAVISSQVFPLIPPNGLVGYGGLEVIAYEQAKGLALKGHDVTLIAPEGSDFPYGKLVTSGPPGKWDEKKGYSTYWQHLLDQQVVLDHSWNKYSVMLRMEGRLTAPSLLWLHAPCNTMLQSLPNLSKPCFVCISHDQAEHFQALFDHPAKVAWNGCDVNYYQEIPGVKRTDRYLFLARFSSVKAPLQTIETCLKAGVSLDMVGDTSITNEPALLERCKQLAEESKGQIRIIGGVNRNETVFHYSRAKALIHLTGPRIFKEPFGLAPVEAQLCKCPVVAFRHGALRETVLDCESGILVDSLAQAVEVLKTDLISKIDREECRKWATRFSLENMVNRVEELCYLSLSEPW